MDAIFELARSIGAAVKQTPQYNEMERAKAAFDADPAVLALLEEYNVCQAALAALYQSEERDGIDESAAASLNDRLENIYKQILASPVNAVYDEARAKVEALLRQIDAAIIREITGEEPANSACAHDCSKCGGKCG